ncbi:unnamed protein product [Closterium sp. NIES-53]
MPRTKLYHVPCSIPCIPPTQPTPSSLFRFRTHRSASFWQDTPGEHSPLVGFLADGIPLYGPRGAGGELPSGVDECGGHVGDGSAGEPAFYHYHASSTAPYTVACLKGCVSSSDWGTLGSASCTQATSEWGGIGVARGVSGKSCERFQTVACHPCAAFFTPEPYLVSSPLLSCPPLCSLCPPLLCSALLCSLLLSSLSPRLLILPLPPQTPPPRLPTPEQYDYSSLAAVQAA